MNKRTLAIIGAVVAVVVVLGAVLAPSAREAWVVRGIVARNVEARGGAEAWEAVESLRFTGTMDIGQGMEVPFVLEQKRPNMGCMEYEFDGATVSQCTDGERGWKVVPFTGKTGPVPLTADELRETVDGADPRGLLFDHRARGHDIDWLGQQELGGRTVDVLRVTLPRGAVREVYLDAASGLEVKVVSTRLLATKVRPVHTVYSDWTETDGLLVPRRQVTHTEGDDESHALVVNTVQVNVEIDDVRFVPPMSAVHADTEG